MSRVLVVEDEQHLAEGLRFNLEAEGYQVQVLETGEEALRLLSDSAAAFDVMILDVMLPGKDGFSVMSELRAASLFADDYLTKPFELAILIARIRGLIRRRNWLQVASPDSAVPAKANDRFVFGADKEKSVDFDLLELRVRERVFRLTLMEANLLRYLIEHEGKPVPRKVLLQKIWSLQEDTDTRPIDNFIVRLRRYIEDDPTRPRHFVTVRGVGYSFVAVPS
jgi:DNA-binding response OmpR family regulator